jgi:hypothetical protein
MTKTLPRYLGPAAWTATEMRRRTDWIVEFDESDVQQLLQAAEASRQIPIVKLDRSGFALPKLGAKLRQIQHEVVHGRGFVLLRGIPVDSLDRQTAARVFYGVGTWFGDAVPQNAHGHLLGHVKDLGLDPHDPRNRVYATSYRHLFHTDSCDIVGLFCLRPARKGGLSSIASSVSIYNEIVRTRPDLAEVLARPFTVDRKGEIPPGKQPTYQLAVFHHLDGKLTTVYARDFIEAAQRFDDAPRLTPEQRKAMDLLDELAAGETFRLDMDFRPGDIQFLHNHQVLHARTAYEDDPRPEFKRHLLRLWLSAPNGRRLPPALAERYGEIEVGKIRGGIRVPGQKLSAPLEAE